MEELAQRFCRGAKGRGGLRYSQELRRMAVEYAVAAEQGGRNRREIAEALGLPEVTLQRWRQAPPAAAEIHEVKVVGAESSGPVLVMPSGVRVEGMRLEELVRILVALG